VPSYSQADLLTYIENRQRPDALSTLAASAQATVAPAATGGVKAPKVTKVKKAKSPGTPSSIYELFYDPQGAFKFGAKLPRPIGGHGNHVHVAADRKRVVYIGRKARSMGLSVGENKAFSGSTPTGGHATNSYHYKDEAIDVSGSTAQMAAFARWVRRTYNLGR
jgi:hypothetical protein